MVGGLQPVLHHHPLAGVGIPKNHIRGERPDSELLALKFKIHLEFPTEQVRMLSQPRCEISGLVGPHRPQRNLIK